MCNNLQSQNNTQGNDTHEMNIDNSVILIQ